MRDIVDIRHDKHARYISEIAAFLRLDAVGVEVLQKRIDDAVALGNMHLLRVELSHLGIVQTREVWPTRLQDQFVHVNGLGGRGVGFEPGLLGLVGGAG